MPAEERSDGSQEGSTSSQDRGDCDRSRRCCHARTRVRPRAHRARLLLARSRAGHLGEAGRRRLRARACASCSRARKEGARQDPGRLPEGAEQEGPQEREPRAALQEQVDQDAEQVDSRRRARRATSCASPSRRSSSRRRRRRSSACLQPQAAEAVQVQVDPGRGDRLSQQRPDRDHAWPLHGAEVARQADQRPGLQPVQDHQRQEPGRRGLLRLPVALPERSEPDRGPRPVS